MKTKKTKKMSTVDKRVEIIMALGRGYTTKRNKGKGLDIDLINDMAEEILRLLKRLKSSIT